MNVQQVGACAVYPRTHGDQHTAKLLNIRFACGIVNGGGSFGHYRGHDEVGGPGYGGFVEQDVTTFQFFCFDTEECILSVKNKLSSKRFKSTEVGIEPTASDFIPAGLRDGSFSET